MNNLLSILVIIAFVGSAAAYAGPKYRYKKQQRRIDAGVQNGSLTMGEQKRLQRGQKRIQNFGQNAASDGKITRRERKKMRRMQNKQSKRIFRKKHNNR